MNFGGRIKHVREQQNLTQDELAARVGGGIRQSTIQSIENRDSVRSQYASAICKALGLNLTWALTGQGYQWDSGNTTHGVGEPSPDDSTVFVASVRGARLSAGNGHLVIDHEEIDRSHAFRRDYMVRRGLNPERCKLFRVEGDSMSPTLNSGDIVMLNMADRDVVSGKIYGLIAEDGIRIKRLIRRIDGVIEMRSDSPLQHEYPPEPITSDRVAVIGKAVWHAGDL